MSTTEIVVLVVIAVVLLAVVGYLLAQQRKRKALQSRFGPEYDRTVEDSGGRRNAERELAEREQRRQQLDIHPLSEQDRRQYADRWRSVQEDFVDRPALAVRSADVLVTEVMGKRGYPVEGFDQQARDLSVDHAHVVHEYRSAHDISELNDREEATTEQLRQAMVHYRSLFVALVEDGNGGSADRHEPRDRSNAAYEPDDERGRSDAAHSDDTRRTVDAPYDDDRHVADGRDEGRRPSDAGDDRSSRTVVEGGLVRPDSDRAATDRPGEARPR